MATPDRDLGTWA